MWILVYYFLCFDCWGFGAGPIRTVQPLVGWQCGPCCWLPPAITAMHQNPPKEGGENPSFTVNALHQDKCCGLCLTDAWKWSVWLGNSFFHFYISAEHADPLSPAAAPGLPCLHRFFCIYGQCVTCPSARLLMTSLHHCMGMLCPALACLFPVCGSLTALQLLLLFAGQ